MTTFYASANNTCKKHAVRSVCDTKRQMIRKDGAKHISAGSGCVLALNSPVNDDDINVSRMELASKSEARRTSAHNRDCCGTHFLQAWCMVA